MKQYISRVRGPQCGAPMVSAATLARSACRSCRPRQYLGNSPCHCSVVDLGQRGTCNLLEDLGIPYTVEGSHTTCMFMACNHVGLVGVFDQQM